jgi:hypothetical protein
LYLILNNFRATCVCKKIYLFSTKYSFFGYHIHYELSSVFQPRITVCANQKKVQLAAYKYILTMIFMVTPCINDIKHFIVQIMHTTLKT